MESHRIFLVQLPMERTAEEWLLEQFLRNHLATTNYNTMASSNFIDLDDFVSDGDDIGEELPDDSFLPIDTSRNPQPAIQSTTATAAVGDQQRGANLPIYNANASATPASDQVRLAYPGYNGQIIRETSTIPIVGAVLLEDSMQESEREHKLRRQLEEQNQRLAEQNRRLEEAEQQLAAVNHPQHNVNRPPDSTTNGTVTTEEKTGRNRTIIVGIVLVIAGLAVGGRCGSGNCARSPSSPSLSGTEAIVSYINSITLSGRTLSYPNNGSLTEEQALNWLIDEDVGTAKTNQLKVRQRFALATLWFQNGPFWSQIGPFDPEPTSTWLSSMDESAWEGIWTSEGGEVRLMSLAINGLSGQLPSDLGLLTGITVLSLYDNELTGSIPSEVGMLTSMVELSLYNNQMTGSIPSELAMLTALTSLRLHGNEFTGSIPSELAMLTSMTSLILDNNQLTGSIPSELGRLTSMEWLNLHGNQLTGTIPTEIVQLTSLYSFLVYDNNLSGDMPFCKGAARPYRLFADCQKVVCECCTQSCPLG